MTDDTDDAAVRRHRVEQRAGSTPARGSRRRGEMSVVSGLIGITAVAAATLAVSAVAALISALATFLF